MSSRGRPKGRRSSDSTTKKKFGKNLNKLTKKPAPPITAPAKSSGSSRNGLLLLSTKRSSSSSGLLASKSATPTSPTSTKETRPLGVVTESYTSAHDALLGAVIGASRTADPQQPPDAWGVANEKQQTDAEGSGDVESNTLTSDAGKMEIGEGMGSENPQGAYMSNLARERAEQRRFEEDQRIHEQKERAAERLRELEQKMATEKQREVPTSLLSRPQPEGTSGGDEARQQTPLEPIRLDENVGIPANGSRAPARPRTLYDPDRPYSDLVGASGEQASDEPDRRGTAEASTEPEDVEPHFQMVNLSSFEDRDRGERSAGPRMLFDPISGSMVEVKDREKSGVNKKGGKPKGRNARDRGEEAAEYARDANGKAKKGKGRKEDTRKRETPAKDDTKQSGKSRSAKKRPPSEPRLPRTCGVLYTRDKKGNSVSADGCDGDYGYGCHSVPGGRVQNPNAYKQLLEDQQLYETGDGYADEQYYASSPGETDQVKSPPPVVDWVKPNEKIELVTGAMDSPTLQAAAREWVPSAAALTAAATAKQHIAAGNGVDATISQDENEETDELDEDDLPHSFIGLGFDPAENMASVMRSPTVDKSSARLDSEGLAALALDAPRSDDPTSRNIFAFGAETTWGETNANANATHDLNGWSMLSAGNGEPKKDAPGASFLSLSTSNTWGTGGLSGLGGPAISQTRSSDSGPAAD